MQIKIQRLENIAASTSATVDALSDGMMDPYTMSEVGALTPSGPPIVAMSAPPGLDDGASSASASSASSKGKKRKHSL